jgi:hypothetical protein
LRGGRREYRGAKGQGGKGRRESRRGQLNWVENGEREENAHKESVLNLDFFVSVIVHLEQTVVGAVEAHFTPILVGTSSGMLTNHLGTHFLPRLDADSCSNAGRMTGKLSSREKREDGEQDEEGESVVCLTVVALLSLLGLVDAVLPAPVALVRLATSRNGKERATHEHSWDSSCEQCKRCVRLVGVM